MGRHQGGVWESIQLSSFLKLSLRLSRSSEDIAQVKGTQICICELEFMLGSQAGQNAPRLSARKSCFLNRALAMACSLFLDKEPT
jgi:hypothetical protein